MRTTLILAALIALAPPVAADLSWQSVPEWATPRQPYNGCCETLWAVTGKSCGAGSYGHGPVPCSVVGQIARLTTEDVETLRIVTALDENPSPTMRALRAYMEWRDRAIVAYETAQAEAR
jgi:hypothetical protein